MSANCRVFSVILSMDKLIFVVQWKLLRSIPNALLVESFMHAPHGHHQSTPVAAFLDLLKRRMVVSTLIGLLATTALAAWFLSVIPLYQADAKLVVDQNRHGVDFSPDAGAPEDRYSLVNTQRDLLVSYPVLIATVAATGLTNRKEYAGDPVRVLQGRLKATSNKDSWVLDLMVRDENPHDAVQILKTVIDQYQIQELHRHQLVSAGTIALLKVQTEKTKSELSQAHEDEQALRLRLGIVSSDPNRNPLTERIAQLDARLLIAERELAQADVLQADLAAVDALPTAEGRLQALVQVPDIRREAMVQSQYQLLGERSDQRRLLLKKYLETNPEVVQLDSSIATVRDRLETSIQVVRAGIAHQRTAIISQRDELRDAITASRSALLDLRSNLDQLQLKREETATRERIFQTLMNRQHEEEANSLLVGQVVTVVEQPHAGSKPVNVRRNMSLIASLLLGLVAAIGAAYAAETFDRRIRDTDSVSELTDLPTLGVIPHANGLPLLGRHDEHPADRRWQGVDEAFRMMRSTLQLSGGGSETTRIITVTSPSNGEGRTTVVSRLGMSLAAAGRKVLVIDGDLRSPALHRHLGMPDGAPGLAELLAGKQGISPIPTSWPQLHLLGAGNPTASTAELLERPAFHQRISDFTELYDYILFDAPSLEFSEALELGALADHILLVIRDRFTLKQALLLSEARLGALRGKVLGLVINDDRTLNVGVRLRNERAPFFVQVTPQPASPQPASPLVMSQATTEPIVVHVSPPLAPLPQAEPETKPVAPQAVVQLPPASDHASSTRADHSVVDQPRPVTPATVPARVASTTPNLKPQTAEERRASPSTMNPESGITYGHRPFGK